MESTKLMKKYLVLLATVMLIGILTGCGHVDNPNKLYEYAKQNFGDCEMIDKETHGKIRSSAYTEITCKDKEYGFTYVVRSYMQEQGLDGATFFHLPHTVSSFESTYMQYIYKVNKDDIDAIAARYNVEYEPFTLDKNDSVYHEVLFVGHVIANDSTAAGNAAVEIGKLYVATDTRKYFTAGRQSYDIPWINGTPVTPRYSGEGLGHLSLGDLKWHSSEEQHMDKIIERARTYDPTARLVGQHTALFSETGASLKDVTGLVDLPTSMDSVVILHDFVTDDGKEFWVADFTVVPEYGEHKGACSNFDW